jgi:hypothetical protein
MLRCPKRSVGLYLLWLSAMRAGGQPPRRPKRRVGLQMPRRPKTRAEGRKPRRLKMLVGPLRSPDWLHGKAHGGGPTDTQPRHPAGIDLPLVNPKKVFDLPPKSIYAMTAEEVVERQTPRQPKRLVVRPKRRRQPKTRAERQEPRRPKMRAGLQRLRRPKRSVVGPQSSKPQKGPPSGCRSQGCQRGREGAT